MMPEMDGFAVFKEMRNNPNSQHIPVIFVTAKNDNQTKLQGLECGAIDYITKPIDPELLKIRLANFMSFINFYKQAQENCDLIIENAKLQKQFNQNATN